MASAIRAGAGDAALELGFGPYRVVGRVGTGGMGVVYEGEHTVTNARVAIKTVQLAAEGTLQGLRREVHALQQVQHPGVVRVLDQGVANGLPWYAMELLSGRSMRSVLDEVSAKRSERTARTDEEGARVDASETEDDPEVVDVTAPVRRLAPHETPRFGPREPAGHSPPVAERTAPTPSRPGDASNAETIDDPASGHPSPSRVVLHEPRSIAAAVLLPMLTMIRRLCTTLAYLHGRGIVHRDLKPDNVIVRDDWSPVLLDFGIASRFGGARGRETLEVSGRVVGSPWYMAPEQIRGELADARADLYALGCILYEVLTGRPPFVGASVQGILFSHLTHPVTPPALRADVPRALDELVMRLLAKHPADRIGHADDVARALGELGAEDWSAPLPRAQAYLYRPPFAGREGAMDTLAGALSAASEGHGSAVLVGGESGAGKTRLVMEAAGHALRRDFTVITSECVAAIPRERSGPQGVPLQALRPLLVAAADRCRARGPDETYRVFGTSASLLGLYELSLRDLPRSDDARPPASLPPAAARARVLDAVKRTIFALADEGPVLLVIDDLQWADELSMGLLTELADGALDGKRALVVGTYRAEEQTDALRSLLQGRSVRRVDLGRVDPRAARTMVTGMLAMPYAPPALVEFVQRKAEGNPFFVAEYLRSAIGAGLLTRDATGNWCFEPPSEDRSLDASVPMPLALAKLVASRLVVLSAPAREALHAAAVLGREAELDLLLATARLADQDAMAALDELRLRQILEDAGKGSLRFVHDKLREAAYEGIEDEPRASLHRRAALAIEARSALASDPSAFYPRLAHHFSKSGMTERALHYFVLAGDAAKAAFANEAAAGYYQAALATAADLQAKSVDHAPARGAAPDLPPHVRESLGDVLALTSKHEQARAELRAALATAPPEDRLRRARMLRKIAKTHEIRHENAEALTAYREAEAALAGPKTSGEASAPAEAALRQEWVQILVDRVWLHYWLAQVDEMLAVVERLRPVVEREGTATQRARFFQTLVSANLRRERYRVSAETVRFARRSLEASLETRVDAEIALARFVLGFQLLFHDALDEADVTMRAALADAERIGDVTLQARCITYVMAIQRRRGEVAPTEAWADRTLTIATKAKMLDYAGAAEANLAWVAWRRGDAEVAETRVREAIDIWKKLSPAYPYPLQWMALLLVAAIDLEAGRVAECADHARAMLEPKQQRLPEPLEDTLTRAVSALDAGRPDECRDHLAIAVQTARRLDYL